MMRKTELEARRKTARQMDLAYVLAMPAGRDVDIRVAEKVMGWTYLPDYGRWVMPGNGQWVANVQEFSSDIRAAWEVVEELLATHGFTLHWQSKRKGKGVWKVNLFRGTNITIAEKADTAPLAICRAALKAVSE